MSEETGASGVDYELTCPICGKTGDERKEHCLKSWVKWLCPNMGESCGKRSKTHTDRRQCAGYSSGHIGTGTNLGTNIMGGGVYSSRKKSLHPLYTGGWSIEAHHLISSDLLNNSKWTKVCEMVGYNVNCWLNGVFLPSKMIVACHAYLNRHKGDHELGDGGGMSYVIRIETELERILSTFQEEGEPCDEKTAEGIIRSLNNLSKDTILPNIKDFIWTIAWDGLNYAPGGIGCANSEDIDGKRKVIKDALKDRVEKSDALKFIHANEYSYDDMRNLRNANLAALEDLMCSMDRDHTWNTGDKSRELKPDQVAKIATFIMEIGH